MHTISVRKIINAPVDQVWESWDDYGNIFEFNPQIRSSHVLSSSKNKTGKGARRECNFVDGKNWVREEIVDYVSGQKMTINVYDGSMPLKSMVATIECRDIANSKTEVCMTATFEPKMGFVGQLIAPLMKRQFKSMLAEVLQGNADYLEKPALVARAA